MGEVIGSLIVIAFAVGLGVVIIKALIEVVGKILPYIVYGFAVFIVSGLLFGFSAEAATFQGISTSVALGIMKANMIGL